MIKEYTKKIGDVSIYVRVEIAPVIFSLSVKAGNDEEVKEEIEQLDKQQLDNTR